MADRGFTLTELLVVISISTLLMSILLPALVKSRESARLVQCASNLNQLITACNAYAAQFHNRYPPNLAASGGNAAQAWYDDGRVGAYLPIVRKPWLASWVPKPMGGVFACPNDGPGTIYLSYAINIWACSKIDNVYYLSEIPASARLWSANVKYGYKMILMGEAYSNSGTVAGYSALAVIGGSYASSGSPSYTPLATSAGQRFGGQGGVLTTAGRFGKPISDLCFMRHRTLGTPDLGVLPVGRLNLGYADGHVESKSDGNLVTPSGRSTGDSCWSPADMPSY